MIFGYKYTGKHFDLFDLESLPGLCNHDSILTASSNASKEASYSNRCYKSRVFCVILREEGYYFIDNDQINTSEAYSVAELQLLRLGSFANCGLYLFYTIDFGACYHTD